MLYDAVRAFEKDVVWQALMEIHRILGGVASDYSEDRDRTQAVDVREPARIVLLSGRS
jgi:hypothetical protein